MIYNIHSKKLPTLSHNDEQNTSPIKTDDYGIIKNHSLSSCNISVIITSYNYENYISKCIESVLDNNYDSLEIVVVDDASTDNSISQIIKYFDKNNFTLINKIYNTGLVRSRNLGIDLCVGDYIFILDADNIIFNNCLKEHYNAIKDTDYIASYSEIICCDINDNYLHSISNKPFNYDILLNQLNYIDAMAMFNKQKFIDLGKYDINMAQGFEDYEIWLRIGKNNLSVKNLNKRLSKYIIKPDSMTHTVVYPNTKKNISYLKTKYPINFDL